MNVNNSGNSYFSQLRLFFNPQETCINSNEVHSSNESNLTDDEISSNADETIENENELNLPTNPLENEDIKESNLEAENAALLVPGSGVLTTVEIKNLSLLNKSYPDSFAEKLDLKLFAHEAASSFIGESPFEGLNQTISINNLLKLINNIKQFNPHLWKIIPQIKKILDDCLKYEDEIISVLAMSENISANENSEDSSDDLEPQLIKNRLQNLNTFATKVMNDVLSLPVGKKIFFRGGWTGHYTGHFVVYIFERTDENNFSFTIINTGGGLVYHSGYADNEASSKKRLFMKFENIEPEQLTINFFEPLIGLRFYPKWSYEIDGEQACEFLYEWIIPTLGQPIELPDTPFYDIRPQRSGTCAMKGLLETIRYVILDEAISKKKDLSSQFILYKLFRLDIQRVALIKTCLAYFKSGVSYDRNAHKLINEANKVFSKWILKYSKFISAENHKIYLATIKDITIRLKEKKGLAEINFAQDVTKDRVVFKSEFDDFFTKSIQIFEKIPVRFTESLATPTFSKQFSLPNLDKIEPLEVLNFLKNWSEIDLNYINNTLLVLSETLSQLKKLPVPLKQGEIFWSQIPQVEIENCLNGLFNISKSIFPHLFFVFEHKFSKINHNWSHSKSLIIEMNNLLAIGDYLARQLKENHLNKFSIYSKHIFEFDCDFRVLIFDPTDHIRLQKILNYFRISPNASGDDYLSNEKTLFCINNNGLDVNEENLNKYDELKFYKCFVNEFKKQNPHKNCQNLNEYILYIAKESRLKNSFIPKSILFLKNLAYISQLFCRKIVIKNPDFHFSNIKIYEFGFYNHNKVSKKGTIENQVSKKEEDKAYSQQLKIVISFHNYTDDLIGDFAPDEFKSPLENYFLGLTQNEIMSTSHIQVEKLLIQNVDLNDEIVRVLSYITKCSRDNLEYEKIQNLIETHFFNSMRLLNQIINEPKSSIKILKQLESFIEYFYGIKKWDTCLFFVKITSITQDFIRKAKIENEDKFSSIKLDFSKDYRNWALKELLPRLEKIEEVNRFYATIIKLWLSKKQFVSPEEFHLDFTIDFFISIILKKLTNTFPISLFELDFDLFNFTEINQILNKLNSDVYIKNRVLNGIIKAIANVEEELHWSETSKGCFESLNYTINLKDFIFIGKHKFRESDCPKEKLILSVISSYKIMNDIKSIDYVSENNVVVFDKNGKIYINRENNKLTIKRQIDGRECDLYSLSTINLNTHSPNYNFEYILPFWDSLKTSIWKVIDSKDIYLFYHADGRKFYIEARHSFINNPDFFNENSRKINLDILKISEDINFERILVNHESLKNHEILTRFVTPNENYRNITPRLLLWSDRSSNFKIISKIEMPQLNFVFYLEKDKFGKDQYFSNENTGFYLSSDQMKHLKNKWPPFLVLENENGEKKIMMHRYYAMDKKTDFEGGLYQNLNDVQLEICNYRILNIRGKIRLKPDSIDSALNLIILLISTKRFNQALEVVSYCRSVRNYTEKEKRFFIQFFQLTKISGSSHPSAISIRLKIALIALENKELMSKLNLVFFIRANYFQYLDNLNNNALKLTTIEEELIITYLLKTKELQSGEKPNVFDLQENFYFNDYDQLIERLDLLMRGNDHLPVQKTLSVVPQFTKHNTQYWRNLFEEEFECYITPSVFQFYLDQLNNFDNETDTDTETNLNIELPYEQVVDTSRALENFNMNAQQMIEKFIFGIKNHKVNLSLFKDLKEIDGLWNELFWKLKKDSLNRKQKIFDQKHYRLIVQENKLISLANQLSPDINIIDSLKASTQKRKLNLDDILVLFEKGSKELYKKNTLLSDQQIIELDKQISIYLVESTRCAQLKRIIHLHNEYESNSDLDEKNLLLNQLKVEYALKREYSFTVEHDKEVAIKETEEILSLKRKGESDVDRVISKNKKQKTENGFVKFETVNEAVENGLSRSYLIMEYRSNFLLRKIQVEAITRIEINLHQTEKLLDISTGSGKSIVLAPLLQRIRQKDKLVFNLWPQSLFQTNKEDIKNLLRDTFGQIAYSFEFDRNSDMSENALLELCQEFAAVWNENKQINTTPESLQCFELKFLEVLNRISEGSAIYNNKNTLMYIRLILKTIYHAEFHIDEGHINLSPRREVNFTLGTPKSEPSNRILFAKKIFEFLSDGNADTILGITEDRQRFTTPEQVKQVLIDLAMNFVADLRVTSLNIPSYLEYVFTGRPPNWMYGHPNEELFVLLEQYIHKLLPTIFEKSVNVNFGLSRENRNITYAKPYHGNDAPIENADYENVHETLAKSFITYLHTGLSFENLWSIIINWQNIAKKESTEKGISLDKTSAYSKFHDYFGVNQGNLFTIEKELLLTAYEKFKFSKKLILLFVADVVAPTILKYPFKIRSTSQDLLNMSNRKNLIFTATPGRIDFYRSNLETISIGTGSQEVVDKLLSDQSPVYVVDKNTAVESLQFCVEKLQAGFRMLIDVGALFKGLSNIYIVQTLKTHFKNSPEIKGVVFFDEKDQLKVLRISNGDILPLNQSGLKPRELFTYCDQRHAFGTDTKQFSKAKALATFDLNNTLDEVKQGVGRLRQFLQGQKVEWVMNSKTKSFITKDEIITIQHLLAHAHSNQQEHELENCIKSLHQQITQEIRKFFVRNLIFCENADLMISFFSEIKSLILESVDKPFKLPNKQDLQNTENPLIKYYQELVNKLVLLPEHLIPIEDKNSIIANLLAYEPKIIALEADMLKISQKRSKPLTFSSLDMENEVQNQNQVELNKQSENTLHQQSSMDKIFKDLKPYAWSEELSLFDPYWPQQTRVYNTTNHSVPLVPMINLISRHAESVVKDAQNILFKPYNAVNLFNEPLHEILFTANFTTIEPFTLKENAKFFTPLAKCQKTIYEVLIIEDAIDKKLKWTVVVGDQSTDARFWRKKLINTPKEAATEKRRVCLYDLTFGIAQSSQIPFTEEEISNNMQLQNLITKIKLYNGDLIYSEVQRQIILELANTKEARRILKAFFERAIIWKPEQKQFYKGSWLESILTD